MATAPATTCDQPSWGRLVSESVARSMPILDHSKHPQTLTSHISDGGAPANGGEFTGYDSFEMHPSTYKLFRSQSDGTGYVSSSHMDRNRNIPRNERRGTIDVSGPITYTPATHRVSKAKKGKRVHACQFPGCTKVFTRAEHRRRHELNHNPQATFLCMVEGCGKGFHRSDLLARHLEKHEPETRPTKPTVRHKRRISQISSTSENPAMPSPIPVDQQRFPAPVDNHPPVTPPIPSQASFGVPSPFDNGSHPNNSPASLWDGVRRTSDPATELRHITYLNGDEPTLFSSPECSRSPSSNGSPYQFHTPQNNGMSQFPDPTIDPLLGANPLQYGNSYHEFNPFDSSSLQSPELVSVPFEGDDHLRTVAMPVPLAKLDGDEWLTLRRELTPTSGAIPAGDAMGVIDVARWQDCFECYWRYFHPLFPVIHRPSFLKTQPSALIAGVMVAIGSQYDRRPDAKIFSLDLLEACQKLVTKKSPIKSRSLVSDIQSVVLIEFLSKYRSRKAEVKISHQLRTLYGSFTQDRHWVSQNPLGLFNSLSHQNSDNIKNVHKFWLEHETRRRALHAMFMIDVHQSVLFQQPLAFLHSIPGSRVPKYSGFLDLPFPCNSDLWECSDAHSWIEYAKLNKPTSLSVVSDSAANPANPTAGELDPFQSGLVLTFSLLNQQDVEELMGGFIRMGTEEFSARGDLAPSSPCIQFAYHALLAARYTPLQALVTVSSESWLFNRKVVDEAQFQTAKRTLRGWVSDTEAVKKAVWHAVRALQYTLPKPAASTALSTTNAPQELSDENVSFYNLPKYFDHPTAQLHTSETISDPTMSGNPQLLSALAAHASCDQQPPRKKVRRLDSQSLPSQPMQPGPLMMLPANWSIYICTLICWAYGFNTISATSIANDLSSPLRSTPLISPQVYISTLISLAPSWSLISNRNIPDHIRQDTTALLEYARLILLQSGPTGGLLHEAEQVLSRLLEPRILHQKKMWDF